MKTLSVKKAFEKAGYIVKTDFENNTYSVISHDGKREAEWYNEETLSEVHAKHTKNKSDSITDYCARRFLYKIKYAVSFIADGDLLA